MIKLCLIRKAGEFNNEICVLYIRNMRNLKKPIRIGGIQFYCELLILFTTIEL